MTSRRAPGTQSAAALARWLGEQRWYTSVTAPTSDQLTVLATALPTRPAVAVATVAVPAPTSAGPGGELERYQLLTAGGASAGTGPDVAGDAAAAAALGRFVVGRSVAEGDAGTVTGRWLEGRPRPGRAEARVLMVEQSNASAVLGGTHILKVFRRLRPGIHPEIEIGRHLAEAAATGRPVPAPALTGWYELEHDGTATALGVVHAYVPGALDGWTLALGALAGDPGGLLARLHALGTAVAALHEALASPGPGFGSAPLGADRLARIAATVAAEAEEELGIEGPGVDALAAVAGRGGEVAALAGTLVTRIGTDTGPAIRTHGDLHLGQVLLGEAGWLVVDFEGEPDRPLAERRAPHAPLRDVAGMLRSIAYAVATHELAGGRPLARGWEAAARAAFLDGYLAAAPAALLPTGAGATRDLLALFELEKVLYEVAYERGHRPDWLAVPARGVADVLARVPR